MSLRDTEREQNIVFYESQQTRVTYRQIRNRLRDIEVVFLAEAVQSLQKPVHAISMLDLGCGTGRTTLPLANQGFNVIGLDLSWGLLNDLHGQGSQIGVVQADASSLPFAAQRFDIVLFSHNGLDCIFPLASRQMALREVARVLRKDGFFIFSSHALPYVPYNLETVWLVLKNILHGQISFFSGYFSDWRAQGVLTTYAATLNVVRAQLGEAGFVLLRHSKTVELRERWKTNLLSYLSWERYYLAQKVG